jgi:hypothetical protein
MARLRAKGKGGLLARIATGFRTRTNAGRTKPGRDRIDSKMKRRNSRAYLCDY